MSRNFTHDDCSPWLVNMASIISLQVMAKRGTPSWGVFNENYLSLVNYQWLQEAIFAITILAWLAFLVQTKLQRYSWGHAHTLTTVWSLLYVPLFLIFIKAWRTYDMMAKIYNAYDRETDPAKRR